MIALLQLNTQVWEDHEEENEQWHGFKTPLEATYKIDMHVSTSNNVVNSQNDIYMVHCTDTKEKLSCCWTTKLHA